MLNKGGLNDAPAVGGTDIPPGDEATAEDDDPAIATVRDGGIRDSRSSEFVVGISRYRSYKTIRSGLDKIAMGYELDGYGIN